jgi:hypothetical protein
MIAFLAGPIGEATYYNPGIMERVRDYRLRAGQIARCADCVDSVALLECRHLGKKVWLRHPKGEVVGPLQVVDCAARKHAPALRRRQWVADVSYQLGHDRWKMRGPLRGVTVLWAPPARIEPGRPHRRPARSPDDRERQIGPLRAR